MNAISLLTGIAGSSLIFWIVVGAITHARWIQALVNQESNKINQQNSAIEQQGYGVISSISNNFYAKRGFVFGYWDDRIKSDEKLISGAQSPKIFDIAGINLIAFTSVFFLIAASKGLFSALGMVN